MHAGSQILVSLVLKMEAPGSFSLVAEEVTIAFSVHLFPYRVHG
jgi:hypothetical protein